MGLRAGAVMLLAAYASACTTLIAGRLATTDGSVMASHSNDGEGDVDPRLVHIAARDHAIGARRAVYWSPETYPRYIGSDRGVPEYYPAKGQRAFESMGSIEQVPHTYSYHEQTYGALNEHGLGIGESTCSSVFASLPLSQGGKALFSVDQLTQIAMERATTAREAVQLMGDLAVKHGFYGASNATEGGAESLMVIDGVEGWIFHVLPDDMGASAIWVAQRVPDDHVGVVANAFMIREVDLTDSSNQLGSANMYSIAQKHGLWDGTGSLDFTRTFSDGEYLHKYYSGRRVWGAYHILAPSADLPAEYEEWRRDSPYPSTLKSDGKVSLELLFKVMRSHYEDTSFDQTKGLAAGPWGSPDHAMAGGSPLLRGSWERTIGLWRTSDSHVVQSKKGLPKEVVGVLWWGPHAASTTMLLPFFSGASSLPAETLGHYALLDKKSSFWACRYVFNLLQLKYSRMFPELKALQQRQHARALETVHAAVDIARSAPEPRRAALVAALSASHAEHAVGEYWVLFDRLMFTYGDGFVAHVGKDGSYEAKPDPYPDWWLAAVNYSQGPPPIPAAWRPGGASDLAAA